MLIIREDRVDVALPYVQPLFDEHYQEVANTAVYTVAPDLDRYRAIEANGNLVVLLALTEDMECVGYSINFLTPHIHYKEQLVMTNDLLFVSKAYRDSTLGARLMLRTKQEAKKLGCVLVQYHAKPNTALDTALRKRLPVFESVFQDII